MKGILIWKGWKVTAIDQLHVMQRADWFIGTSVVLVTGLHILGKNYLC